MSTDHPAPRDAASRARPRSRKRLIVLAMVAGPITAWCLVAVIVGTRAPLAAVGLAALLLPLIALPQVWPDLTRQRAALPTHADRSVVFDAPAAERWSYAALAILLLAAPWVVRWDAARIGEQLPGQVAFWLWLALPLGVAGLLWQTRWRRVQVSLAPSHVAVQTHQGLTEVPWGQLAAEHDVDSPPLDAMLAAGGAAIDGHMLRTDPDLVAAVLEFYRTNPALRHELATGEAIDRVRRGDLTSPRVNGK